MILLALLASLAAADTAAIPRADSVITLPEVRVEGDRPRRDARRRLPTASVSEIEAGVSGRALETVADLLGEAPGVRVRQYGGLGAFSTVSLRGAPPGQVAVYLDGAPLSSAAHGVVSLGDLPATAIERIEVYRGLSPLGLGPASPGGAIHLVTVSAPDLRVASVMRGAFGTWEARGSVGGRRGPVTALVHAGHQRSRGDFEFWDDNGTPLNLDDDGLSMRVNNRFAASTALTNLAWRRGSWLVQAHEEIFHKAQGVPGLGATPAYRAHLVFTRARSRL
ncbi:MAG TPA: TonB-dependent receptor plug domain-containing protein, partial [Candidatus Eisenbacteria bacterium]|nr:TonB-dependent receptor plug domain-containing protein [Candidatus Eisenbacteria bacterium]